MTHADCWLTMFVPGVRGPQCPGDPLHRLSPRPRHHRAGTRVPGRGPVVSVAAPTSGPDQRQEEEEPPRPRNYPRSSPWLPR